MNFFPHNWYDVYIIDKNKLKSSKKEIRQISTTTSSPLQELIHMAINSSLVI